MSPQLESVLFYYCTDESTFVPLFANTFPHLEELTISDMTIWTSLQVAIEKRLKNGNKSLRKIQSPEGDVTETIMSHLRRWLPTQGIGLVLYKPGELPESTPVSQDESCDKEVCLFVEISNYDYDTGFHSYYQHWDDFYDDDEEGYGS